ncbi:hypothetical protein AeNC1_016006 [Aphanomyces euteiches]|nr:hypothetical protein AeNC1_016006 [Aphanomyces euteiches]
MEEGTDPAWTTQDSPPDANASATPKADLQNIDQKKQAKDYFRKFWHGMLTQKYLEQDNQPAQVLPNLFVGSVGAASNWESLCSLDITHILVAGETLALTFEESGRFEYLRISVSDTPSTRICDHFEKSNAFIDRGVEKGRVLVHCFAGKSRSVSLVIAYLIATNGHTYESALAFLRNVRPHARPNNGFAMQLKAYAKQFGRNE